MGLLLDASSGPGERIRMYVAMGAEDEWKEVPFGMAGEEVSKL